MIIAIAASAGTNMTHSKGLARTAKKPKSPRNLRSNPFSPAGSVVRSGLFEAIMDEILTANDIALICDVEISTVKRWLLTGKLKGRKFGMRAWAILPADVDAALASGVIRKSPGRGRRPIALLGQKALK